MEVKDTARYGLFGGGDMISLRYAGGNARQGQGNGLS